MVTGEQAASWERGRASEWLVAGLVLSNLWWATLVLGGYRPETMIVSSLLTGAALVAWLGGAGATESDAKFHIAGLVTLPFLAYAAVNAAWVTPVPWLGWWDWLGWLQMAVIFWVVTHGIRSAGPRWALFGGLVALGVVAIALAAYQTLADPGWLMMGRRQVPQFIGRASGPFGIPNCLAALLNLLLPPLLALTFQRGAGAVQRVFCGYLAALFAVGTLLTVSRGAWLALGLVLVVWPLLSLRGSGWRRSLWSACVAASLLLLATGLYLQVPRIKDRVDHLLRQRSEISRVVMWRAGWALFEESPLLGAGAGSYNVAFERHRPARFWDAPRWAHNDYLNTLSDYGALGFTLSFGVAAALAWPMRKLLRSDRVSPGGDRRETRLQALRGGLLMGLLAFAFQLLVDFNLKIPALAQAASIAAALVVSSLSWGWLAASRLGQSPASWRSLGPAWVVKAGAALVVAVFCIGWVLPIVRAEALRYGARQKLDRLQKTAPTGVEDGGDASWQAVHQDLTRAVSLNPRNGQAWSDLADAFIHRARTKPAERAELGRAAEHAAARALALSEAVPEFWQRQGVALHLQGRWREADAGFKRAIALAPNRPDFWYYYAWHQSFINKEEARRALATCLQLDPWNQPAITLQRRLDPGPR